GVKPTADVQATGTNGAPRPPSRQAAAPVAAGVVTGAAATRMGAAAVTVPGEAEAAATESALKDALAQMRAQPAGASVSDRLGTVVSAMHRTMGFSLSVLALKDVRSQLIRPVILIAESGGDTSELRPLFEVDLESTSELFALLAQRKTDVYIADAQADSVRTRVPRGLIQGRGVRSFLFMSLNLEGRVLGYMYADFGARAATQLPATQLALLKSMRDEAVGAFRKRVA
ncbi:MAG TPA: GAF domain-containing protein, partial [Burkholderiaceae bacterium]|nr:GAF domain-containing protein [Burkholderiaceae bacterium]